MAFAPRYRTLVVRSPADLAAGAILAGAMLILFWAAILGFLSILAACGVSRTP